MQSDRQTDRRSRYAINPPRARGLVCAEEEEEAAPPLSDVIYKRK